MTKKTASARIWVIGLLLAVSSLACFGWANAGTLGDATLSGPGLGAVTGTVGTPNPNNDNATSASPNGGTNIAKRFDSVGNIDIRFQVNNSDGTTEYFFGETVTNNTGVPWTDFHMVLGFGTGANFVISGLGDNLDFDTCGSLGCSQLDPTPTSNKFGTLSHGANELSWTGGIVPNGQSVSFTFSFDVPDASSCSGETPACEVTDGGYVFTLREFPTTDAVPPPSVPLPGSLILVGFGAVAAWAAGWKQRRSTS